MAQDHDPADSVFDFLYADMPRLGQLLSQLGQDGFVTELTRQTESISETGGHLGIKVAGINSKDGAKSGLLQKFDPRWLIPLRFLDLANASLKRDIDSATLGQLVIVDGTIAVTDVGMLRALWDEPVIHRLIAAGIPQEVIDSIGQGWRDKRRSSGSPKAGSKDTDPVHSLVAAMMKMLPHAVHVLLHRKDQSPVWGTLSQESMVGTSADLFLKHGSALSGRWHMIGILDALPSGKQFDIEKVLLSNMLQMTTTGQIMENLGPMRALGFGRPDNAFGITPLIIMRPIDLRAA